MKQQASIGIDPGTSGSTVIICDDGATIILEHKTTTWPDYCEALRDLKADYELTASLEEVHAMPGNGATSMFSFGRSYGNLEMALTALEIRFERVKPQMWQRHFSLITGKTMSKTQKKNLHKQRAQEIFPGEKITHATADALLIAEFCRRTCTRVAA